MRKHGCGFVLPGIGLQIARWTLPRWFHVCITAMTIYLMVYQM